MAAWIYPYSAGGSRDALQQLFTLGALSIASILLGFNYVSRLLFIPIVTSILLVLMTPNPYGSSTTAGLAAIFLLFMAYQVGMRLRRSLGVLTWVLFAIVVAAFINAIEGLLQWFGLVGSLYEWMVVPELRGVAVGALRQVNLFATFLCVGSICTAWLVDKKRLTEPMGWFLLSVLMFGVAASGSRTGILEIVFLASFAIFYRKQLIKPVKRLFIGQLVILILALFFLPQVAKLLDFEFTSGALRTAKVSHDARWNIWQNSLKMISERPWLGWGWRETGYAQYITLFNNRYQGVLDNVHNLPLQITLEFGFLISVPFIFCLYSLLFYILPKSISNNKTLGKAPVNFDRLYAWCIVFLIVGIHSLLEYPLWYVGFLFLSGLFLGYLVPLKTVNKPQSAYEVSSLCGVYLIAASLLTLAFFGWQQYAKVLPIYKTPFTKNKIEQRALNAPLLLNASDAWLFREHLDFAALSSTTVTQKNALEVRRLAEKLLHFSAEPHVIQPLLLSLWYLKDFDALRFHAKRFCLAFPSTFSHWSQQNSVIFTDFNQGYFLTKECRPVAP